jgi:Tol biopolymer transport system component
MKPGDILAHYTVTEKIGAGGMGEVFRASDTKLGRDVALKVLPAGFDNDSERLARFQREARTLASLQHPNVASVYGLEAAAGKTFLVMELVEGEDLCQRLGRGALPVDQVVDIVRQIATGLEAAHDKGIVHRDLKPANVKVGADGTVKILDFGLARAYEGDAAEKEGSATSPTLTAAMTNDGVILGTAAYMSPEQARGMALDKRTDIFSFGVVLYEMLTGAQPFRGETLSDTLASILKEQPDRGALPPGVPPAIRLLLDRCLEKDPKKRIRDIGEARLILEAVQAGDRSASAILGTGIARPGPEGAGRARIRRREIAAWAVAAILIVALGAVLKGGGDPLQTPNSVKLAVPIQGAADLRYSHGGLAISPDGTRIAYINQKKLYVRRLDSWDPIEIPQTEGVSTPFWSPDSRWLAFGIDKVLWKVRPDGTERTMICTTEVAYSRTTGGAWMADDRIVYRGLKDLMAVPASGGDPVTFVSTADSALVDFHEPEALPGGQGLIVVVHTPAGVHTIGVVSQDGTLEMVFTDPEATLGDAVYSTTGHVFFGRSGDIWAMPLDLGKRRTTGEPFLVARNAAVPGISQDGTFTYVRNAGMIMRQLVLVDRQGEVVARLGQPGDIWAAYALSPDGTQAATIKEDQADIWLHDNRLAVKRATYTDIEHDMISFSPDGGTLYFATGIESDYRIGSITIGRNEPEKYLVNHGKTGPHYYAACPFPTADGRLLFYSAIGANGKQDIAWLDLTADAEPQFFLTGEAAEYGAVPSPADPRYVAYVSDESGSNQVFLTTWPDAGQKFSVSIDGGLWPRWKGDGSELYFALGNDIFAVEVRYDPVRLGRPEKLFARPEYDDRQPYGWPATFDVTPDGQRFLVTELVVDDDLEPAIAVIPNWSPARE